MSSATVVREPAVTPAQPSRTNVLALVLVVAATLVGLGFSAITFLPMIRLTPMAVLGGVAITAAVTAIVWFLMTRSVLWTPMGWRPIVPFLWGGFASMTMVLAAGDATTAAVANLGWADAEYAFGGAWPEEVGKLAGVALILLVFGARWHRPWDGLLCGILVGLGFELVETVQYAAVGAVDDPNSDLAGFLGTWLARGVAFPGLHVFFTGLAGWALGMAMLAQGWTRGRRIGVAAAGFVTAFVIHFPWNYEWSDAAGVIVHVVLWVLAAGLLAWAWVRTARLVRAAREAEAPASA
ncbi:PrsW family intramembrane metalloprotease [Corynebacterium sp. 335C]